MMDQSLRFIIFTTALLSFAALEVFFSYQKRKLTRRERLPGNFGLILSSSLLQQAVFPLGLIYFANLSSEKSIGLLNLFELPTLIKLIASLIILDLAIYVQHVLSHRIDILWNFHRVHHTDVDLDTTSALRFHPVEIFLSSLYKAALILILGVNAEAIFIFEIILNFTAMFNHSNIYIPKKIENFTRFFVVTPQMHIIHHSVEQAESDTNYGFNLSIWDRIFRTYTPEFKSAGLIGQTYNRKSEEQGFWALLKLPFTK